MKWAMSRMPRKKMEQFNSFETADGGLFHLGTVYFLVLLKEFHKYSQLNWHTLWNDEHRKPNWRMRTPSEMTRATPQISQWID